MEGHPLRPASSLGRFYIVNEKKPSKDDPACQRLLGSENDIDTSNKPRIVEYPRTIFRNFNRNKMGGDEEPSNSQKYADIYKSELPAPWTPGKGGGILEFLRILAIILSFVAGLVVIPLLMVVILVLFMVPRILFGFLVWATSSGKISLMPLLDSFKAAGDEFYEVVLVLRGRANMSKIKEKIQAVIEAQDDESSTLKYPSLRQTIFRKFGFSFYENHKESFEVQNHIKLFPAKSNSGLTHSELLTILQEDFHKAGNFPEGNPQWEILVVPKFSYDSSYPDMSDSSYTSTPSRPSSPPSPSEDFYAIVFRAHSAILDKQSALSLFTDDVVENSGPQFISRVPLNKYTKCEKLQIVLYTFLLSPFVFFKTFLRSAPVPYGCHLEKGDGQKKMESFVMSFTPSINFESVISAKDASQTSIRSVLTSCTGVVARNLILGQDLSLPNDYRVTSRSIVCPCWGRESIHNLVLPSAKFSFALDRLRDAYFAIGGPRSDELQVEAEKWINLGIFWFAGSFPTRIAKGIYKRVFRSSILLEIWPVAGDPCRIFGNDYVTEVFAWNSIANTHADFGITITTYANRLKANIIARKGLLAPSARKTILADEFIEEYTKVLQPLNVKRSLMFLKGQVAACELNENKDN